MNLSRPKFYFINQLLLAFLFVVAFSEATRGQSMGFPSDWGYWKRDLILTSAFMGPNAIPVPAVRNGVLSQNKTLSLLGASHFSSFDKTYNPFVNLFLPFAAGKVAIEIWSDPFEYYNTDSLTLVERKAWSKNSTGYSGGDVYIATLIQIVKNHSYLPDMVLSINLKTASGGNLEALRHTDTPGYYFDLSMGKTYRIADDFNVRPFGLIGFFVYQTHQPMHPQNDAPLWGFGVECGSSKFTVKSSVGGYYGYFNEGDRPIVLRGSLDYRLTNRFSGLCGVQLGLQDFSYTSFQVGVMYCISKAGNKSGN